MTEAPFQADPERVSALLLRWILPKVDEKGRGWLEGKRKSIAEGAADWVFFTAFSAAPRYTGKADLFLTPEDLEEAAAVRPGWFPQHWSVDQAARTLLVLALPAEDAGQHVHRLEQVFTTADVAEQVALYQALPLLPHPERYRARAAEGLRSNITSVFNAVALRNPYPAEYFDDAAWNQLVLKAVFVGSPLHLIDGLDRRANPELARMLVDYVHERWAASRSVPAELWRPVGPFADADIVEDLAKALLHGEAAQQEAAALALARSPSPRAREVLSRREDLLTRIEDGSLSWDSFHRNHPGYGA